MPPVEIAFPELALPALPEVPPPAIEAPTRTGTLRDEKAVPAAPKPVAVAIALPADPPPAPVTLTAADVLAGAIEVRLAEAGALPLPPRFSRRDREALAASYAARGYRPFLVAGTDWAPRGAAVAAVLARADADGLDAAHYPVPRLGTGPRGPEPGELAEAELKLAAAAYLYARDARGGRLDPARLSPLLTPSLDLPTVPAVLDGIAEAADAGAALARYQPAYPGYRALREALASLRANRPAGPVARAPAARRAVRTTSAIAILDGDDEPPAPLPALAWSNPRLEGDIIANMERWRWLPADVASRYVAVNVPEFRLRLWEDGRVAHETRVITGKPETPTPILSGLMDHAVVNPSWFIPPSILKKEILPGLARDPGYAARRGYEVVRRGNAISVRQPPGERNALGFIKFMFPNNHAVYLHDTPNRNLFGAGRRAFSHGCVRVENPFRLADFVLGAAWTEERLRRLIGRGERRIDLPGKLPVHLTYFTVAADESGALRFFEDLYGHHRRVRVALGLGA